MSYQVSPVVVLPLICPSRALALYVAYYDGKEQVEGAPPSRFCFCCLSVRCASATVVLLVLTASTAAAAAAAALAWSTWRSEICLDQFSQPAGVHTLELAQLELQALVFIS